MSSPSQTSPVPPVQWGWQAAAILLICAVPLVAKILAGGDLAVATRFVPPALGCLFGIYCCWGTSQAVPMALGWGIFYPAVLKDTPLEEGVILALGIILIVFLCGQAVRLTHCADLGVARGGLLRGTQLGPLRIDEQTKAPLPAMGLFVILGPVSAATLMTVLALPFSPPGDTGTVVLAHYGELLVGLLVFAPLTLVVLMPCQCERPSFGWMSLSLGSVALVGGLAFYHCSYGDLICRLAGQLIFPVVIWLGFTAPNRISLGAMAALAATAIVIEQMGHSPYANAGGDTIPLALSGHLIALTGGMLVAMTASIPLRRRRSLVGALCETLPLAEGAEQPSSSSPTGSGVEGLRLLVDSAPTAGALIGLDGPILYANQAYATLVSGRAEGADSWALRGVDSHQFFANPMDRRTMVDVLHRYGQVQGHQYALRRQSGAPIWVQEWWVPIRLDDFAAVLIWCVDITERKRDEDALRQSERRLRAILDESPAGVLISRRGGKIIYANPKAAKIINIPRSLLIGADARSFYADPQWQDRARQVLRSGGHVVNEEVTLVGGKGEKRTCLLSVLPIEFDGQEARLGWSFDITERKQAEDAVQASERRLRSILEACPLGLMVISLGGGVRYANPALLQQLGALSREQLTHPVSLLASRRVAGRLAVALRNGAPPRHREAQIRRLDGSVFWALLSFEVGSFEGEQAVFIWSANIANQKAAERALADHRDELEMAVKQSTRQLADLNSQLSWELEQRKMVEKRIRRGRIYLRAVLDTVADGIITLDHDGRIEDYNPSAEVLFGLQRHLHLGFPITDFIYSCPQGRSEPLAWVLDPLGIDREVMGRHASGREFPASFVVSATMVEDRPIYTCVVRDITDRKRAEKALLEAKDEAELANRSKSDFLANMSHELRTPLNAILGFSEIMQSELFGPVGQPKYLDYISLIQQSGRHLLDVINDILDIARIEAGQVTLYEEDVEISQVIASTCTLFEPRVAEAGQTLTVDVQPHLPVLRLDRRRIKQMLLNLLSNASKFTPKGGQITVRCYQSAAGVHLDVEDTGIGMTEGQAHAVLKPFVQVDTGLDRRYEGTGLGLPLVVSMAAMHQADFTLTSSPGCGTAARLIFPLQRIVAQTQTDPVMPVPPV